MHWAGPLGPARGHRDVGLQCHSALGTGSGSRLTHLGIHGTHVCCSRRSERSLALPHRIRGSDFETRTLRNILLRVSFELLAAAAAAEVIQLALVLHRSDSLRAIDIHPANRIFVELPGYAGRRRSVARSFLNGRKTCLLYTSPSPRDRTRSRM